MLPLNSTATRYGTWHRLSHYRPKYFGLHLVTVHPGGNEYWSFYSGPQSFGWGVFASTQEQACLPNMFGTSMTLPPSAWFKGEAIELPRFKVQGVKMFKHFVAPKSRQFIKTYNSFFAVPTQDVEPEVEEEIVNIESWETKDKTAWFLAAVKPAVPGTYEAVDAMGFKGPVVFDGRKWETRVTKWRGLNNKAHAKAMKHRELNSQEF